MFSRCCALLVGIVMLLQKTSGKSDGGDVRDITTTQTSCCNGSDARCRSIPREHICERIPECSWSCDQPTSPPSTPPPVTESPVEAPPPPVTKSPVEAPPRPVTESPAEAPSCCDGDHPCQNILRETVCNLKPQCNWDCDSTDAPTPTESPNEAPTEPPSEPPNEPPSEPPSEASASRACMATWDPVCISTGDSTDMSNAGNSCEAEIAQRDDPNVTVECECGCPCDKPCPEKEILNCCINKNTNNPCGVSGRGKCMDNTGNGCEWVCGDDTAADLGDKETGGSRNLNLLIVGGEDFEITSVQWMGILKYSTTSDLRCGVILIAPDWGLTASHCVDDYSSGSFFATFGATGRSQHWISSDIVQVILFPDYSGYAGSPGDIALVQFGDSIYDIQPAVLRKSAVGTDEAVSLIGWGRTCGECSLPETLQKASTKSISATNCKEVWGDDLVKDDMVCFLHPESSQGSCNGDSGGPAFDSEFRVVGVTSWGEGGCSTDFPSVYTRVSSYCDWIEESSGDSACQ